MFTIENFTRPYIPDISTFSNIIIGKGAISEKDLEHYIYNPNFFCKIIIDQLTFTHGFIACEIVEKKGVLSVAGVKSSTTNSEFELLLLTSCIEEFEKRDIQLIETIISEEQRKNTTLIEALVKTGFQEIEPTIFIKR